MRPTLRGAIVGGVCLMAFTVVLKMLARYLRDLGASSLYTPQDEP